MLKPVDLYFSFLKAYESEIIFLNLMQALETYHAFFANDLDKYRVRVEELVDSFAKSDNKAVVAFLFSENQEEQVYTRSRLADLILEKKILLFPRVPPSRIL